MMNKNLVLSIAGILVLMLVGAMLLDWSPSKYSKDPQVAALEKIRDETFARPGERNEKERRAEGEAFRGKMEGLTEQQRKEFFERSAPLMISKMAEQMEQRFKKLQAMPIEERRKELDKAIDMMEKRSSAGGPGGKGGPPRMDPQKIDEMRKKMLDWTTPQQRAMFENGLQMMNDRRKERGLKPITGPPGMF